MVRARMGYHSLCHRPNRNRYHYLYYCWLFEAFLVPSMYRKVFRLQEEAEKGSEEKGKKGGAMCSGLCGCWYYREWQGRLEPMRVSVSDRCARWLQRLQWPGTTNLRLWPATAHSPCSDVLPRRSALPATGWSPSISGPVSITAARQQPQCGPTTGRSPSISGPVPTADTRQQPQWLATDEL